MAPEQWRAEPASPVTDVYAATCVFFECVTGRRPYDAEDAIGMMGRHLTAPVPADECPSRCARWSPAGWPRSRRPARPAPPRSSPSWRPSRRPRTGRTGSSADGGRSPGPAVALAALFPLAAAGLGTGGTAGQAAGMAAGKGMLGSLGTKSALAVAGTAVVAAGGATAYYVADRPDPPPRPRPAANVALRPLSEPARSLGGGGTWRAQGQVVRVTGLRDAALERRIDAALRAPLDRWFAQTRSILGGSGGSETYTTVVRAAVRLRGPRLISVRDDTDVRGQVGTDWGQPQAATVDLTTGTAYGPAGPFLPGALTGSGLRELDRRIKAHLPGGTYCPAVPGARLEREHITGGRMAIVLNATFLEIAFDGSLVADVGACGPVTARIPYNEVAGRLDPAALKAVPYP